MLVRCVIVVVRDFLLRWIFVYVRLLLLRSMRLGCVMFCSFGILVWLLLMLILR